jgi:hypothetical protein
MKGGQNNLKKCQKCHGPCTTNDDCDGTLECYKRTILWGNVPGCSSELDDSTNYNDDDNHNVCYDPLEKINDINFNIQDKTHVLFNNNVVKNGDGGNGGGGGMALTSSGYFSSALRVVFQFNRVLNGHGGAINVVNTKMDNGETTECVPISMFLRWRNPENDIVLRSIPTSKIATPTISLNESPSTTYTPNISSYRGKVTRYCLPCGRYLIDVATMKSRLRWGKSRLRIRIQRQKKYVIGKFFDGRHLFY